MGGRRFYRSVSVALSILAAACGGDDQSGVGAQALDGMEPARLDDDPVTAKRWAVVGSAPRTYLLGTSMITLADLAIQLGAPCPTMTESGTSTVYQGDCTDEGGDMWTGRATVSESGSDGSIVFEAFGATSTEDCEGTEIASDLTFTGDVSFSSSLSGGGNFDVDVVWEGTMVDEATCTGWVGTFAIDYEGQVTAGESESRWSGSGRVGSSEDGVAEVATDNEILDSERCADEALSGTTRIESGGHTVAITYDGITDCDPDSTVTWSFDGEERGELSGVICSISQGGSPSFAASMLLLILLRASSRRRLGRGRGRRRRSGSAQTQIRDA